MQATVKYLKDYTPFTHHIPNIRLDFDIQAEHTDLIATFNFQPKQGAHSLTLQGKAELLELIIDGNRLPEAAYTLAEGTLRIPNTPTTAFTLQIRTRLYPQNNKSLNGLYESGGNLYTQCEPEGFRTMTYHPDRPDVMSEFTVKITADADRFPVLLANGNRIEAGVLSNNRHYAIWHDPFAKPSYLFALVAGQLTCTRDSFITQSDRQVAIEFYTRAEDAAKVDFAVQSLKHAMRWDETRFGLEYDLDIYMIVAVGDFNMGAMENKGLNIFNTKYVLADRHTATDTDFEGVESVIAHEYFHNWTGNRVTCRDWFQLSLKEGLTVFRDQEFSADRIGRDVCRIENVAFLRQHQFAEDAGPMAHPVRPASYIEMNNFYTMTVYEKGAEVVRLYHTLLSEDGFQRGMKLYFERHDGQAVTCDDFRAAMADANQTDLSQLALWYSQAGTPLVRATGHLKPNGDYELHFTQHIPATPDMADKKPMPIPIKIALFGANGATIAFRPPEAQTPQTETVLLLTQSEQTFVLQNVGQNVVPSLLRGFSAPVRLEYPYSDTELACLLAHDTDPFARWEAGQHSYRRAVEANLAALQTDAPLPNHETLMQALHNVLQSDVPPAFQALLLTLPATTEWWSQGDNIDPILIHQAREALLDAIAHRFADTFAQLNQRAQQAEESAADPYAYRPEQAAWRRLRNVCRQFLLRAEPSRIETVTEQYEQMAQNMTHEWGILTAINHLDHPQRDQLLQRFAEKYATDDLVMDKYFGLIASSHRPDTFARVQAALQHPAFKLTNPNKVRSLLGSFARNIPHFHAPDGQAYRFLAEYIRQIDAFNPQTASALTNAGFSLCQRLEPKRRALMQQALQTLADQTDLSQDTRERVEKILA